MDNFCIPPVNGDSSDTSSSGSTPEPPAPFVPKFNVHFTDCVTKDGESVKFTLKVFKNDISLIAQIIERVYEDFEYLEHCVITDQPSHGLIIPPLPVVGAIDAESAVAHTKKHMGKGSKIMLGDDFKKDCHKLQRYLTLLLSHPVLGESPRLQEFLLNKEAPPRTKIRKGLISKLSDTLEFRKMSYPDCEDFFQKERDWLIKYNSAMNKFSHDFDKITYAQIKIMHQHEQIMVALRLNQYKTGSLLCLNNLNHIFMTCIEQAKNSLEEKIVEEDLQVGCLLDLWAKYVSSEESMLLTRTSLMIDYQACNRALDKAKPNRKQIAEKAKENSEEVFERCSDVARKEIKRFQLLRTSELSSGIIWYIRHQITHNKRSIAILSSAIDKIKAVSVSR